jgi:hypothetical protein
MNSRTRTGRAAGEGRGGILLHFRQNTLHDLWCGAHKELRLPCVTAQRAGRRNEPPEHQNQYSNMKLLSHVQ